jgi:hypothetical protein
MNFSASKVVAASAAVGAMLVAGPALAATDIDRFNGPDVSETISSGPGGSSPYSVTHVNGANSSFSNDPDRNIDFSTDGVSSIFMRQGFSILRVFDSASTTSTLNLLYDEFSGGSADLTTNSAAQFRVEFAAFDGEADLNITVDDGANQATSSTQSIQGVDALNVSETVAYSQFSGVDLSSVESIGLELTNTNPATAYNLSEITTAVPEPTSLALFGLGFGLCASSGLQRRKRA